MDHLINLAQLSPNQVHQLLDLALEIKNNSQDYKQALADKYWVMLFEKPSLRTRLSFEIGIKKLGGNVVYLDQQAGSLGGRETVSDFAANISCWADGIIARVNHHETIVELSKGGTVPVVNALCDLYHPCQALADALTLKEHFEDLSKVKLAYLGDGNNVCHSLMLVAAHLGMTLTVATPLGHGPDANMVAIAQQIAVETGAKIQLTHSVDELGQQDAVYTDTWISMGQEKDASEIEKVFMPFQINQSIIKQTGASKFMHCQPAHRDHEVSADVMDGPLSVVLQQAENRMHAQNAVLVQLSSGSNKS